jgi:hypothetical protein
LLAAVGRQAISKDIQPAFTVFAEILQNLFSLPD